MSQTCPHCGVLLTDKEANAVSCPVCNKRFSDVTADLEVETRQGSGARQYDIFSIPEEEPPPSASYDSTFDDDPAQYVDSPEVPLQKKRYAIQDLDPATQSYLRAIHKAKGRSFNGSYFGKSVWSLLWAIVGFGMMAVAVFQILPDALRPDKPITIGFWTVALFSLGGLFFFGAVHTLIHMASKTYCGSYTFTDGCYLWEVEPHYVSITPVWSVYEASGTHQYTNGSYQHTDILLHAAEGTVSITINSHAQAEDFVMFHNACGHVIRETDGELREALRTSPELRAAFARRILDNSLGQRGEINLDNVQAIPRPAAKKAGGLTRRHLLLCGSFAACLLMSLVAFPMGTKYMAENQMFALVQKSPQYDRETAERYLRSFPKGRHAEEVLAIADDRHWEEARSQAESNTTPDPLQNYLAASDRTRHRTEAEALIIVIKNRIDDQHWEQAKTQADDDHSPASLRDYLANDEFTRHREKAQEQIGGFYDEAIARIKSLASNKKNVDQKAFKAWLAVLESLKTAKHPVVTIGFESEIDPLPTGAAKIHQEEEYKAYKKQHQSELEAIERRSLEKTAILPLGEVFSQEQIRRREETIRQRLTESVSKVLSADIIRFQPVVDGETPNITVGYKTTANGDLYLYTHTETRSNQFGFDQTKTKSIKGLLRSYSIGWTMTFRPPNSQETISYKINSQPAKHLRYREGGGSDPDWAIYAILMYSAFHDYSSELIKGFGLTPPPAPNSFSFADATGTKESIDTEPFRPGRTPLGGLNFPRRPLGTEPDYQKLLEDMKRRNPGLFD